MGNVDRLSKFMQKKQELQDKATKSANKDKKTAYQRMQMLFDPDSFCELSPFDSDEACVKAGNGKVGGRLVYAYSLDSADAGAVTVQQAKKIASVLESALKVGAPVVSICDSNAAKVQEGMDLLSGIGDVLAGISKLSGVVPQIAIVLGQCVGVSAYIPTMSDFVIMQKGKACLLSNGAAVINNAKGKNDDAQNLGGADVHAVKTGVASFVGATEAECIESARKLLDMLPSNNLESAPIIETADAADRANASLNNIIPDDDATAYDVTTIIKEIADDNEFCEITKEFAKSMVTGFVKLGGMTAGVVANQTTVEGGIINADAASKAARFIRICDSFNIPVVTIVDTVGLNTTCKCMAAQGAKLVSCYSQATVPVVTLITGKAFGSAYIAMGSKSVGADYVLAYPSAQIGILPADTAALILYRDQLGKKGSAEADKANLMEMYKDKDASCYNAAAQGYVDSIIEPSATRASIIAALETLESKRITLPAKKHNNYPI